MKNQCESSPTCLPDPCWPGGTADMTNGCICKDGWIKEFTPGSAMQNTCRQGCLPAVCGDRGTCKIIGTGNDKKETCTDCNCPWSNDGDDTNMCGTLTRRYVSGTPCFFDGECCSNNCYVTLGGELCA